MAKYLLVYPQDLKLWSDIFKVWTQISESRIMISNRPLMLENFPINLNFSNFAKMSGPKFFHSKVKNSFPAIPRT